MTIHYNYRFVVVVVLNRRNAIDSFRTNVFARFLAGVPVLEAQTVAEGVRGVCEVACVCYFHCLPVCLPACVFCNTRVEFSELYPYPSFLFSSEISGLALLLSLALNQLSHSTAGLNLVILLPQLPE